MQRRSKTQVKAEINHDPRFKINNARRLNSLVEVNTRKSLYSRNSNFLIFSCNEESGCSLQWIMIFAEVNRSTNSVKNVYCKKMSLCSKVELRAEARDEFHRINSFIRPKILIISKWRNGKEAFLPEKMLSDSTHIGPDLTNWTASKVVGIGAKVKQSRISLKFWLNFNI